ncbi:MAG: DUF167 domain-containing protein [Candidatus Aenigmarchaeota archaeon]|nr:DUF167 domain-containing protein [Candidatus Aenigmarchaeota archaeon]
MKTGVTGRLIFMIINVKVRQGSRFSVVKGETWLITISEERENNAANHEIIRELSKEYSAVRILRGASSRRKVLEVIL